MELILPSLYTSILVTFSLVLYFLILRSKTSKRNSPPEAGGAWPIIGHAHLLAGKVPHVIFGKMADKSGPAFIVRLGLFKALVVSRWDLAKECFTTNDFSLLTRPETAVSDIMSYDHAMVGFSPYGPYWREIRKLISLELLSTRRLELQKHVRLSEIQMSTNELYKFWDETKAAAAAVVDMQEWFGNVTMNTILTLIAGKRYFGSAGDGVVGKEAARVQAALKGLLYYVGFLTPDDVLPFLRPFDIGGYHKDMSRISREIDELVGGWLKERRRKKDSGESTDDKVLMDVMISRLDEAQIDANYDSDTIIKATCATLIAGATDTTSVTLTWALALLMNHPEAMKKVKEELNHHIGKERRLTFTDIPNLVYLQAIIKETFRLFPAGPLGGPRKFSEDVTIGGYHIPKETRLIVNMWKLHRDPNVWSDEPTRFRPERFLTTHKDFDVKGLNFELIPFSAGRRQCPGMYFALQMLPLVLGNLLHAFDFSIPSGKTLELKQSDGLTNNLGCPLELAVVPCLPANLY